MRALALLAVGLSLLAPVAGRAADTAHVYVVVVDGLDADLARPEWMPRLFGLAREEPARTSVLDARAVMPARTNPNHVALLTGAYAGEHGITGNAYWSRVAGAQPAKLDAAALVEVETLFTVIEGDAPARRTVGVFGKPKLARLLGAAPGRQRAPDVLWSPEALPRDRRDPATGYARDEDTLAALLAAIGDPEPDLAVANLADVDRTAHGEGPDAAATERAVRAADAAVGRLVDALRARGRWGRSVLVVTADHGFTGVAPTPARPTPVIALGRRLARAGLDGVRVVADGGVAHVYAAAPDAPGTGPLLARAAALARATAGVAEVLARVPVPGVPSLAGAHPGWHLDHPHTGELLLVAAPGFVFAEPADGVEARLRGNHGGPGDTRVPLVVSGGSAALRAAHAGTPPPSLVDVAPTIARLLGVRVPRRVDGRALGADRTGRVLDAVLAVRARTGGSTR